MILLFSSLYLLPSLPTLFPFRWCIAGQYAVDVEIQENKCIEDKVTGEDKDEVGNLYDWGDIGYRAK